MINWEEKNLGSDLETIQESQKTILENALNHRVTVLAQQPGIGKTTMINNFLENTKLRCAVIVPYHKLVKSEYLKPENKEKLKNVIHWAGFKHKCPKYSEFKDKYGDIVKNLPKKGFLCKFKCDMEMDCPYHLQFKNVKQHIITVPEFLNISHFDKQNFDLIIFDESVERGEDAEFNVKVLEGFFKLISDEIYKGALGSDPEIFLDILRFKEVFECLENDVEDAFNIVKKDIKKNIKKTESLLSVNLYNLKLWFFYDNIYNLGSKAKYRRPYIYDALNKDIPIVISDATFNQSFFNVLYQQYCKEYKINEEIEGIIFYSNVSRKDRIITKLYKNNMFYKNIMGIKKIKRDGEEVYVGNPDKFDTKKVLNVLEKISRKCYNCGFISYPAFEQDANMRIPIYFEFLNIGNTRGLNTLENKEIVVICGTHIVGDGWLNNYYKLFRKAYDLKENFCSRDNLNDKENCILWKDPNGEEVILEKNFRKKPKGLISLNNDKMREENYGFSPRDYALYQIDSTAYQNIHRTRFFRNDMEVYIMGYIPDKIYKEVKVEEFTNQQSESVLDERFEGIYPLELYRRINDFQRANPNIKATTVAKYFNLMNGNKFITAMGYVSPRIIESIDNGIKRGFNKPSQFKRSYPALKEIKVQKAYSVDELLDDCIKYSIHFNGGGYKN